jgi:hypothetical protein
VVICLDLHGGREGGEEEEHGDRGWLAGWLAGLLSFFLTVERVEMALGGNLGTNRMG